MIKFGPSGNSNSFYADGLKHSEEAFKWLAQKNLSAYEYSFGRGIKLSDEKAILMANESHKYNIEISVHAPYYINFSNQSSDMIKKSISYLLNSAQKLVLFGGKRVIFHPATVGKLTRKEAFELCKKNFNILLSEIYSNNMQDIYFCPETMGKINQIGDEIEIANLCKMDKCLLPTIDFGHLNARTLGGLNSIDDFKRIINNIADLLGDFKTKNMHVHFSKIKYSKGGEVRHLTFEDNFFGPSYENFLEVVSLYDLSPIIICESDGTQAEDAQTMQNYFFNIKKNTGV